MRVRWQGGPLDGCVDNVEHPSAIWYGPDIEQPKERVIVYVLRADVTSGELSESNWHYQYRQDLTDRANEHFQEAMDLAFESIISGLEESGA